MITADNTVELSFDVPPQNLTVRCWSDAYWGQVDAREEKTSIQGSTLELKKGGYITVNELGHITLTDSGREIADKIYNRHRVLTKLLEKLGVNPEIAALDACKMEHAISDETYEAIEKFIK